MDFLQETGIMARQSGVGTGTKWLAGEGSDIESFSPVDGKRIASVTAATSGEYEQLIQSAEAAFLQWRTVPAPRRGEVVRQVGDALREKKQALGRLVSYEMGKSLQEG
ncbi:aldehyde dehydrogenase family protein, partial [Chitinophaga sp.]|uniref:aldehyde dehydrogenase family protein n=1 Tax=Chitinophaga sp. TaxID=1869181 RepID=UPI00262258A1